MAGRGALQRQEEERRRVAHRGGDRGRRGAGSEGRGIVPGDGRVRGGVVAEDDRIPRHERVSGCGCVELGPLREVEVDPLLGEQAGDEAIVALLVLRGVLARRILAEELPARGDPRLLQHGVHDLGYPQVLEDARPATPAQEPQARDEANVVLHRAVRLVDLLQAHGGHHAVERARGLADVPGEDRATAQGEALDLLVGLRLGADDDVEGVVLGDRLAAGEGVDTEVAGVEALDGEAVGDAAGAAGAGGHQAARVEGRRHEDHLGNTGRSARRRRAGGRHVRQGRFAA